MQPSPTDKAQISFLLPDLERQLDPCNALFGLARAMDWIATSSKAKSAMRPVLERLLLEGGL